ALYDVTALANESLEVDEMLKRLLEYVLAAMGCNVGTVHLLDEAGETLHLVTQQGLSANVVNRIDFLPVDGSLEGIVIKRGEPLVSLDLATDPRTIKIAQWERGHAYIGVPVQVRGQAMGVLGVTGEMGKRFTMEEVSLMAAIADHAGVVMENTQLRQKTEETAITRERRRLARELHDSVTQSAYSMTLLADAGRELTKAGRLEQAEEYLTRLGEIAQQMLKDMRLLVYELRPLALTQVGLLGALRQRLEIVERRANVDARIVADELLVLPIPVEQALYRIAQEALNNILKHSKATAVTVYIHAKEGWVELEVVDDGLGFDPDATHDKRGIGLIAMSERVEQLGGTLQVISAPGEGTRVKVAFNCQQSAISRG
ncbi:MAG: GAF domain-containing sensor histidine kinase, partial [Chloroflexota bacterium]|nr:GAF domain-containing sensor histidine kinase [Chloroflexota bacterium]